MHMPVFLRGLVFNDEFPELTPNDMTLALEYRGLLRGCRGRAMTPGPYGDGEIGSREFQERLDFEKATPDEDAQLAPCRRQDYELRYLRRPLLANELVNLGRPTFRVDELRKRPDSRRRSWCRRQRALRGQRRRREQWWSRSGTGVAPVRRAANNWPRRQRLQGP